MYFIYGSLEKEYLKKQDKILGAAIEQIGDIKRKVEGDLFTSVINNIVGQQISTAAHKTVWMRINQYLGAINVNTIINCNRESLQQCGLTYRKTDYIIDFAKKVYDGSFDINKLYSLDDAGVIKELVSLRGIGIWTAEMIMIFCMQRTNVLSFGDLAIHRGMRMLYGIAKIDKAIFNYYQELYSPYKTTASLYLWSIAGGAIPELEDPQIVINNKKKTE